MPSCHNELYPSGTVSQNEILPYIAFAHYFKIAVEKQPLYHVSYESPSPMHSSF